jgi:hypothetical protein
VTNPSKIAFTSGLLIITTKSPAKATAAMVAIAYSAVAAPSSELNRSVIVFTYAPVLVSGDLGGHTLVFRA